MLRTRLMLASIFSAGVIWLGISGSAVRADANKPTYEEDVLPVLKTACINCHGNDKQRGGLNLATFSATMEGGSSGAVVNPGDPDKSRLYTLSAHIEEPKMPPNGSKMDDGKLKLLRTWIEQGARENAGSKMAAPAKPKTDIGLNSVVKGRPEGPPPMPIPGKLGLEPVVQARRPGAILAMAASPWAPLLAIGGQKQILLYNTDTADLLGVIPFEHGQINDLKFSRNARLLLAAGGIGGQSGKAVLYNIETGDKIIEVGIESDAILAADISADQSQIAVGSPSKLIRVYSTQDGSVLHEIKKHTDWVTAVEFSPDGVLLATGDRNGGLFVWEAFTAREYFSLRGHSNMITDLSWRDDSNVLASSSEDSTVKLWEMENGGAIKSWGAHGAGAWSVKYSHDNKIVSTGRDRVTKVWNQDGAVQKQFEALPDIGLQVAITHDNAKVFAGDWAGTVKAWTAAEGTAVAAIDANPKPLADQLTQAEQLFASAQANTEKTAAALTQAQTAAKQASDNLAAVQAQAAKVATDLAAAKKLVADHTAAATALTPQVAAAKAELDKIAPTVPVAQAQSAALAITAPAYAATAKTITEAAGKSPQNAPLAEAAKAAQTQAQQQAAALAAAQKAEADVTAAHKAATDKHAAMAKMLADHQAAAAEAQKQVAALEPMVKSTADAVAPAQKAVEAANAAVAAAQATANAATAELTTAKARVDRLKSLVGADKTASAPAPAGDKQ